MFFFFSKTLINIQNRNLGGSRSSFGKNIGKNIRRNKNWLANQIHQNVIPPKFFFLNKNNFRRNNIFYKFHSHRISSLHFFLRCMLWY